MKKTLIILLALLAFTFCCISCSEEGLLDQVSKAVPGTETGILDLLYAELTGDQITCIYLANDGIYCNALKAVSSDDYPNIYPATYDNSNITFAYEKDDSKVGRQCLVSTITAATAKIDVDPTEAPVPSKAKLINQITDAATIEAQLGSKIFDSCPIGSAYLILSEDGIFSYYKGTTVYSISSDWKVLNLSL